MAVKKNKKYTFNLIINSIRIRHQPIIEAASWNGSEKKVTINLGQNNMELWIDSKDTKINGEHKSIDVAPQVMKDNDSVKVCN